MPPAEPTVTLTTAGISYANVPPPVAAPADKLNRKTKQGNFFARSLGSSLSLIALAEASLNSGLAAEHFEKALAALGWLKANKTARERIAKIWIEKGLLSFSDVLEVKPKEFENFDFHAPRLETTGNSKVKVTIWIRLPPG